MDNYWLLRLYTLHHHNEYELEEEDVDLAFSILDQLLEIDHEKIH